MNTTTISSSTEKTLETCCPIFDPQKWDNKTFYWENKKFIKAAVPALFHIPFIPLIGKKITKMMRAAEEQHKLSAERKDTLLLFMDLNPFKSEMYLSVTERVSELKNVTLTGTFRSLVVKGDHKELPKSIKLMAADLNKEGLKVKHYYVHYAYCPKCAEEAGHNYIALFAEIDQD